VPPTSVDESIRAPGGGPGESSKLIKKLITSLFSPFFLTATFAMRAHFEQKRAERKFASLTLC
jgi:hypothetical protein